MVKVLVPENQFDRIEVVAGLIFSRGKVLACQRKAEGPFPLKWEFPGGKVEAGEAHAVALRRELQEELGIDAQQSVELFRHKHLYPNLEVTLRFYHVLAFTGELRNFAFHKIAWVTASELKTLDFLAGDLPVIEFLCSHEAATLFVA
jgi:8-oxo-dGTP diphosphatase